MVSIGDGWSYQLRYIRCGKLNCSRCRREPAHGPYWYAYRRDGARVTSRYVGARLPTDAFDKVHAPKAEIDPRWVFNGRMDSRTALRIMGFAAWPDQLSLTKRWRQLVYLHHPDRGGDTKVCAAINVAYGYLRR